MALTSFQTATGITAHAGGGQSLATPLTKQYNDITVCATAGDSVVLPTATTGLKIWVRNSGAFACDIFPASTTIDDGATSAAVRLQPGHEVCFTAISSLEWHTDNPATGAVTQITTNTTGVTLNALKGIITTVSMDAAHDASKTFTVTNSYAQADSHIQAYILDYAGTIDTNGIPTVLVKNRTDGAFDIVVSNPAASDALSGVMKIGFEIKN